MSGFPCLIPEVPHTHINPHANLTKGKNAVWELQKRKKNTLFQKPGIIGFNSASIVVLRPER
jgi:hypothetical protein